MKICTESVQSFEPCILLTDMERTEEQLRDEAVSSGGYPDDIVKEVIAYVKSFGYINDDGLCPQLYRQQEASKKSKREIYAALAEKGICAEMRLTRRWKKCYGHEDAQTCDHDSSCKEAL